VKARSKRRRRREGRKSLGLCARAYYGTREVETKLQDVSGTDNFSIKKSTGAEARGMSVGVGTRLRGKAKLTPTFSYSQEGERQAGREGRWGRRNLPVEQKKKLRSH